MTTPSPTFWRSVEAIHDVVYFARDAKDRYEAIGLKGYWMGYAASRSAALGAPGPATVAALFHGFAPGLIARALPDAWAMADRDAILDARLDLARAALGDVPAELADSLLAATRGLDFAGRPLAAAHADVPAPTDPAGRLWHAATVFREYRGDSHVAVLTAAGLDGAAANALAEAAGLVAPGQRLLRGWTEDEWAAAIDRLRQRGWCTPDGALTESGRAARAQLESATDRVSCSGVDDEARARSLTLESGLAQIARGLVESGAVAYPNPTGTAAP